MRNRWRFYSGKLYCITIKRSQEAREIYLNKLKGAKIILNICVLGFIHCSLIGINTSIMKIS